MGSQKLSVQIHSIHTNEDVSTEKLKGQYLDGNYTVFETRQKQKLIQKLVGIDVEGCMLKAVVVEYKSRHIPAEQLISEYRTVCEEIAIERQHSTVSPSLQRKLHRIEEIILDRL